MMTLVAALFLFPAAGPAAPAVPEETAKAIDRGLDWLVQQQARRGYWEGNDGRYRVAMTSLAGLALLMEGSSPSEGKYAAALDKAVEWLVAQRNKDGLIDDGADPHRQYMWGHGYATLFLACVYEREGEGAPRADRVAEITRKGVRKDLEAALKKAVAFTQKAQTSRGGWGYVTAAEGNQFDELGQVVVQMQGLWAAKQAGIAVNGDTLKGGQAYLRAATLQPKGPFDPQPKEQQPQALFGSVVSAVCAGELATPEATRWLDFCPRGLPSLPREQDGMAPYGHFYYAQARYALGENKHARLAPAVKPADRLTWARYRTEVTEELLKSQNARGFWSGAGVGAVYPTATYLFVLQLDRGKVSHFRRLKD